MVPAPPVRLVPARLARLRTRLKELGYTHERLVERVDIVYLSYHSSNAGNVEAVGQYLQKKPSDALDALIRLFFLNVPVELARLESLLETEDIALLEDTGLVSRVSREILEADLCLFECQGLYFVTDTLMSRRRTEFNNVVALLPECYDLAAATPRRPFARTLDLCTGSGVHALLAGRHSGEVVGVDVNARAVEFANFNKALNGIDNAAFVEGDLYGPFGGDQFDLVLANPPHIPDRDHKPGETYYSGGPNGEAVTSRIFTELDAHLSTAGICQCSIVMIDWPGDLFHHRFLRYLGAASEDFRGVLLAREIDFDNEAVTGQSRVTYGLMTVCKAPGLGGQILEAELDVPPEASLEWLQKALVPRSEETLLVGIGKDRIFQVHIETEG